MYDEKYFQKGLETGVSLYSNYRWLPELTIPLAHFIIEHLGINRDSTVLDYGCARGYLVKALRLLKRQAYGCDISSYAIEHCDDAVKDYVFKCAPANIYEISYQMRTAMIDYIISKDVLEHVDYQVIRPLLKEMALHCKKAFFVIPLGDGKKYNVPAYELDSTHIIREDSIWWRKLFMDAGFEVLQSSYLVDGIKDNWSEHYKGNGFFLLESK